MYSPTYPHLPLPVPQETPCTELNPREFFVAWSGVLVLAYEPFPNCVLSFKQDIRGAVPSLADENPGSRSVATPASVPCCCLWGCGVVGLWVVDCLLL